MAVCNFKLETKFNPADGDLLLFPYMDEKTPLFNTDIVPDYVTDINAPKDEGKSLTLKAGSQDNMRFIAKSLRLDDKHLSIAQVLKKHISSFISSASEEKISRICLFVSREHFELLEACQEGAILGGYKFDKYLEKAPELPEVACIVDKAPTKKDKTQLKENETLFSWVNFARDILNEPPNEIHPESLAALFQQKGKKAGLKMTVWEEKKLEKEGCGGIIAVGKGASSRPRLVIGEYKPRKAQGFIVLVGKGVTMDTGGYCLKPPNSQLGMKYDMGGAAMAFSAACALASLKVPLRITVITPLVENDISSTAFHTQDIIKMRNGKTVQVDNTDAEGRLILADALCLASEMKPDCIVDAATLTGACVVALGEDIAGVFGRDRELNAKLIEAGRRRDENLWEMPLYMPYMEQLKAEIADMKNIGSRWGGAITAALFLSRFVEEEIAWSHIDIAGPSVKEEPLGFLGKGAKGFGVKTLFEFVRSFKS